MGGNRHSDIKEPKKEPGICTHFCIQMGFSSIAKLVKSVKRFDLKCSFFWSEKDKRVPGQVRDGKARSELTVVCSCGLFASQKLFEFPFFSLDFLF